MGIDADAWKNAFKIYRGGISADRDAKNFRTGMTVCNVIGYLRFVSLPLRFTSAFMHSYDKVRRQILTHNYSKWAQNKRASVFLAGKSFCDPIHDLADSIHF